MSEVKSTEVPECVFGWYELYRKQILPSFDEERMLYCLRVYGFISLEDARNYPRIKTRTRNATPRTTFFLPIMTIAEEKLQQPIQNKNM
jgi:hypothetical protein